MTNDEMRDAQIARLGWRVAFVAALALIAAMARVCVAVGGLR